MNWSEFWRITDDELYLADIDVLMYLGVDNVEEYDGTPEQALER